MRSFLRNAALRRIAFAWLMFLLAEYAVWIGMLVYAYAHGGSTTAGAVAVAVAQLIPGMFIAPVLANARRPPPPCARPRRGLPGADDRMPATAAFFFADGPPEGAYVSAVLASTAVTVTRPAQSTLIPAVATDGDELTAANALLSWLDSLGMVTAGVITGVAQSLGSPGLVFAIGAVCTRARRPRRRRHPDGGAGGGGRRQDADPVGALLAVGDGPAVVRSSRRRGSWCRSSPPTTR